MCTFVYVIISTSESYCYIWVSELSTRQCILGSDKQSKKGKCTIYGCFVFYFLKPPNEKDNMKS